MNFQEVFSWAKQSVALVQTSDVIWAVRLRPQSSARSRNSSEGGEGSNPHWSMISASSWIQTMKYQVARLCVELFCRNNLHRLGALLVIAICYLTAAQYSRAALIDRGGGMIYDPVLEVTWLKDANYAKTSGYSASGQMTWEESKIWADNLKIGGYTDWRLATTGPASGDSAVWNYNDSFNGDTDAGYHIGQRSELSHMFYSNLLLVGYRTTSGGFNSNFGIFGNGTVGGQNNIWPFTNIQAGDYWTGTPTVGTAPTEQAFYFQMQYGAQAWTLQNNTMYAWAVRDGDVLSPVPEPNSYLMAFIGLIILLASARREVSKFQAGAPQ